MKQGAKHRPMHVNALSPTFTFQRGQVPLMVALLLWPRQRYSFLRVWRFARLLKFVPWTLDASDAPTPPMMAATTAQLSNMELHMIPDHTYRKAGCWS